MAKIGDKPMIKHVYDNVCDHGLTVVAVPFCDKVIPYLKGNGIPYFEGDEDDVLSRYYYCAKAYKAKWIWRITADCPLIDSAYLLALKRLCTKHVYFMENIGIDGQDIEGFPFCYLEDAYKMATDKYDREHVTPWMKRRVENDDSYHAEYIAHKIPFTAPKMSVDTPEDLERVRRIYDTVNH